MTMSVDWTRPIQFKDGHPAVIKVLEKDNGTEFPVTIAYRSLDSRAWFVRYRRADGTSKNSTCNFDIINVPEKHVRWINIYSNFEANDTYLTKELADHFSTINRMACIRVEFEEGEGL